MKKKQPFEIIFIMRKKKKIKMFFFLRGWVRRVITCLYIFGGNCFSLAILCPVSPRCILKVPTQMSVILELHSCLQARRRLFVPRATSKTRYFSSNVDALKSRLASTHLTVEHLFLIVSFGLLVRGLYARPRLSLGGRPRLSSRHPCWPPSQMHFLWHQWCRCTSFNDSQLFLCPGRKRA